MKEEEKTKKSSKKWIIAIVLVVVIAVIAFAFYGGILPTGLATGTSTTSGTQAASTSEPAKFTVTGTEVISKDVTEALPYYEAVNLESGRYDIEVITEEPVWIRLYDQVHFADWERAGIHGSVVTGTNLNEGDKTKSLNTNFDINIGEEGKYYLLIMGDKTTSIKFKITQVLKF